VPADNYAGAAIFRIGAPATKNVRAFLCVAQEQYLKITGECAACEKLSEKYARKNK
jgi:hypothetical protein